MAVQTASRIATIREMISLCSAAAGTKAVMAPLMEPTMEFA